MTIGGTLVPGTSYFLADEPGLLCPAADLATGDYPVFIGIAKTAAVLTVNITASGVAL